MSSGIPPSAFQRKTTFDPSGESFSEAGRIPAIDGSAIISRTVRFCAKEMLTKSKQINTEQESFFIDLIAGFFFFFLL
jgi:hypothetical protein